MKTMNEEMKRAQGLADQLRHQLEEKVNNLAIANEKQKLQLDGRAKEIERFVLFSTADFSFF